MARANKSYDEEYKKNNIKYNLNMSIKFVCPKCNNTKIISQKKFKV